MPEKRKAYAVVEGRQTGIFNTWEACEDQVKGFKGAKYKSFATTEEAESYLRDGSNKRLKALTDESAANTHEFRRQEPSQRVVQPQNDSRVGQTTANNVHQTVLQNNAPKDTEAIVGGSPEVLAGIEPLPFDAEDGFDDRIIYDPVTRKAIRKTTEQANAKKLDTNSSTLKLDSIRIYTDGSCLGNGTGKAFAGVGVYFGPLDARNISEPLTGQRQTNQRAELTAILKAVDLVPRDQNVVVVSDSEYAISCVSKWGARWRQNGWKSASGKNVENRDLIEATLEKIDEKRLVNGNVEFEWVKGHKNDAGNISADGLAVDGAKLAVALSSDQI